MKNKKIIDRIIENKKFNLIGRLIALMAGVILLIIYIIYERLSRPYFGHAMSTTSFIAMWITFFLAIVVGPLVGRIYRKLGGKI
jgi:hypothetical protein